MKMKMNRKFDLIEFSRLAGERIKQLTEYENPKQKH